jgi:MSHA pilin protein MshC
MTKSASAQHPVKVAPRWRFPRLFSVRLDTAAGFTTIELIVVIVLTGILAAIAGDRFFTRTAYDVPSGAEQARTMLRYAQKVAVARNAPVFVRFEPNRISLCHADPSGGCAAAQMVPNPGGFSAGDDATRTHCGTANWYCLGRPAAITVGLNPVVNWLRFDALGRPSRSDGSAGGVVLSFSAAGVAGSQTVTVTEETGYVQ